MASAPQITVRTGSGHKTFSSSDNTFAKAATEAIAKQIDQRMILLVKGKGEDLKKKLEDAGNKELERVAGFIARQVIGNIQATAFFMDDAGGFRNFNSSTFDEMWSPAQLDPNASGRAMAYPMTRWANLSSSTVLRRKRKNKDKFFLHQGTLRREIAQKGAAIREALGGVQVSFKLTSARKLVGNRRKNQKVGEISARIGSKVTTASLPSLRGGASFDASLSLEKKIGFTADSLAKLAGPLSTRIKAGVGRVTRQDKKGNAKHNPDRHRPLLQPVLSYWMMFRVPNAIQRAVQKQLRALSTGAGSVSG